MGVACGRMKLMPLRRDPIHGLYTPSSIAYTLFRTAAGVLALQVVTSHEKEALYGVSFERYVLVWDKPS